MDSELAVGFEDQGEQTCEADDWQQISYKPWQEFNDAWKNEAHWHRNLVCV